MTDRMDDRTDDLGDAGLRRDPDVNRTSDRTADDLADRALDRSDKAVDGEAVGGVSGLAAGAAIGAATGGPIGAVIGAAAGALAGYHARTWLGRRTRVPDAIWGALEDGLAWALGLAAAPR